MVGGKMREALGIVLGGALLDVMNSITNDAGPHQIEWKQVTPPHEGLQCWVVEYTGNCSAWCESIEEE
jgi:hypothetical protein